MISSIGTPTSSGGRSCRATLIFELPVRRDVAPTLFLRPAARQIPPRPPLTAFDPRGYFSLILFRAGGRNMKTISIWPALCIAAALAPVAAAAQVRPGPAAIRTYVSGLGNDGNTAASCPREKPCRTLAAAYTVTQKGGEIIALDPGEYGPITITAAVSIFGNIDALIGVKNGGTGVTINAPQAEKVIIRNFIVTGAGATNTKGIALNSGQLALLHSTLKQLTTALAVSNSKADLFHTDVVDIHEPGTLTGGNKITILEFLTSNTVAAYSTNMTGNGTLISGTGASCGGSNCQSLGYYRSYPNQIGRANV